MEILIEHFNFCVSFHSFYLWNKRICYLVKLTCYKQIFVLSAVSPEKMPLVLQNIRKVIKVREASWWDVSQFIHLIFTLQTLRKQLFFFFSSQMVMCCSEIMPLVTLLRLVCVVSSSSFLFIYWWFNKENESQQHQSSAWYESFMIFYFLNYNMTLLLLAII